MFRTLIEGRWVNLLKEISLIVSINILGDFWVGSFGGFIEAIDDFANFTGCESGFVGFGIEGDKQNADFVSQLVNDPIARTFAFLNVTVFGTDFENGIVVPEI
jgi:hypothetical protein